MLYLLLGAVFSYLLGSISPSVIISKVIYKKDIRNSGSGNAGATNTLRVFGKKAGIAVFIFDFFKGFLAVVIAKILVEQFNAEFICIPASGFSAQLGHVFPVFFGFKGGKGVATAAGSAMAVMPLTASLLLGIFALTVIITKTVSLASGICAAVYPLLAYFLSEENQTILFIYAACCSALIIIKHFENFARLLDGKENKLSLRKRKE
ncbi:MAG: glycerol-3-phosphate 1-O-acyltransferase PlsY [Clostridia bacterium]|nr:glycerol-3-phosphate 1-O-acyltransferase PlsY [Clostridia bacterium]